MIVVDVEPLSIGLAADRALTTLSRDQKLEIGQRQTVLTRQMLITILAPLLWPALGAPSPL